MSSTDSNNDRDEMRPFYDFSKAEVGKYHERYQRGTNVVLLAPDVHKDFPNSQAVNEALRKYREMTQKTRRAG